MAHTITEFKIWPKGLETSYHDWIVYASKNEIVKKLGFEPKLTNSEKCKYTWRCNLDNGRYFFTIYDMSYDDEIGDDEVIEYHIGFDCRYDDIHDFWPNKTEALDMLWALKERGFNVNHSETWTRFHKDGVIDEIERLVKKNLKGGL